MKGVILAGGTGSRLREITNGRNKHTIQVGEKPMILYPLETLGKVGCDEVVIVTDPKDQADLGAIVGDSSRFGMNVTYTPQDKPLGTADALYRVKGQVEGVFPLIMGDVLIDPPPQPVTEPTLFWNDFELGNQHSVWVPETNQIIEKPVEDLGRRAIIFYFYDDKVFDFIPSIKPSERGELELVDIHNFYLQNGAQVKQHKGFFGDMGTPAGLKRVEKYLRQKKVA